MSNIIKIFLLGGDKFMPVMYLRQHEFIHSATESFKKKQSQRNRRLPVYL